MNVLVETGDFGNVDAHALAVAAERTVAAVGSGSLELSVTLLDDDGIRALNRDYLGHDRPTDVIAFALGGADPLVGDVYLGVEQARRQADELGIPVEEELLRLTIHGTLHVLGHDHPEGEERDQSPMFALQERILGALLGRAS